VTGACPRFGGDPAPPPARAFLPFLSYLQRDARHRFAARPCARPVGGGAEGAVLRRWRSMVR